MEHSLTNIPLSLRQVISQDYKFFHMPCPFRSWLSTTSYSLWPLMFVPLPNLPHFHHSFTQPHQTGGLLPFVSWYAFNVIELIKKKNQEVKILFFSFFIKTNVYLNYHIWLQIKQLLWKNKKCTVKYIVNNKFQIYQKRLKYSLLKLRHVLCLFGLIFSSLLLWSLYFFYFPLVDFCYILC